MNRLPAFASCLEQLSAAERGEGWLVACEEAGLYLAICQELVAALADVLRPEDAEPILEVCAGNGALAAALNQAGVPVRPTDAEPKRELFVIQAGAEEALRRHRPRVVLAAFVPIDTVVDRLVMRCPTVQEYVVLGARIGGQFGSDLLWSDPGWVPTPLDDVTRWMLTRHDVELPRGNTGSNILQHGEAWKFCRR